VKLLLGSIALGLWLAYSAFGLIIGVFMLGFSFPSPMNGYNLFVAYLPWVVLAAVIARISMRKMRRSD
jgi:hypothetical protein